MRCRGLLAVFVLTVGFAAGRVFSADGNAQSRWEKYISEHASRPLERLLQTAPTAAPAATTDSLVNAFSSSFPGPVAATATPMISSGGFSSGGDSTASLILGGRRRLGEGDDDEEEPEQEAPKEGAKDSEWKGPFCFPVSANEDKYQALLTDCTVSEEGSADAGSCCQTCHAAENCTGYSYISGGSLPKPTCCLALRDRYPRLALQGVLDLSKPSSGVSDPLGLASEEEGPHSRRGLLQSAGYNVDEYAEIDSSFLIRKPSTWAEWGQRCIDSGLRTLGLIQDPTTPMEVLVYQNPRIVTQAFGLPRGSVLDIQDSGAPGLMYVSPESGFSIITGVTRVDMYSLNWYGCPYDKDFDTDKCQRQPPPTCRCLDDECAGYCTGMTLNNFVFPRKDYYAAPTY